MYKIDNSTLDFIKKHEGFSAVPYKDDYAGTATVEFSIGYGHQIQPGEVFTSLTKTEATELLKRDLQPRVNNLNKVLPPGLSQDQFTACLDYTMSFGASFVTRASLFQKIRDYKPTDEIKGWWLTTYITHMGSVSNHLKNRRQDEVNLFFNDSFPPIPKTNQIIALVFFSLFVILLISLLALIAKK